jgi:fatty-acyl-CoA synthase
VAEADALLGAEVRLSAPDAPVQLLVGDVVRNAAAAVPAKVACTHGNDALTYRQLDEESNRVAHTLRRMGVGPGDRVAWWGDTSLEAMPVFAGVAKVGAVFAPVNARLGADEAAVVVGYARPRLVVADDAHAPMTEGWDLPRCSHAELHRATADASCDPATEPALRETDPHVVFFTSGSTGRPKGVVLSHRASTLRAFPGGITGATTSMVCTFPLFHMAGWSMALNAWSAHRSVHYAAPEPEPVLRAVERHRATELYCIPAVWARVLDHGLAGFDVASLRTADTGTSATPPELIERIREALPDTITRVWYGSTEGGPGTKLLFEDLLRKPGSVGRPQPAVWLKLEPGAEGDEVCVRSPYLMDGYFEQPEATAEALRDGWYHTGDLGVLDDEGFLSIVGRARELLRSGGETVAPGEVEAALVSHPAVAEVAVVGVPDPRWGEVVCVVVVACAGTPPPDLDALRGHCDGRLAPFKQPRRLEVVAELPRTAATGQVQRTLLVERIVAGG